MTHKFDYNKLSLTSQACTANIKTYYRETTSTPLEDTKYIYALEFTLPAVATNSILSGGKIVISLNSNFVIQNETYCQVIIGPVNSNCRITLTNQIDITDFDDFVAGSVNNGGADIFGDHPANTPIVV